MGDRARIRAALNRHDANRPGRIVVNDDVGMLRCAYRHKVRPITYAYSVGFRIVCGA